MNAPVFKPGFRISATDMAVLAAGAAAAALLWQVQWWMGAAIAFVVGHFFLFCNVFRMPRPLELVWAATFVALAAATIVWDAPGWRATLALSLGLTVAVVAIQMRRASYHGVGWRRINPGLPEWWARQTAGCPRQQSSR